MMKKFAFWTLAGVVGLAVVSQTRFGSYVSTATSKIRKAAHAQVSPEFQLERVRHEIARLGHDIEAAKGALAEETVSYRTLSARVEQTRKTLDEQKQALSARLEQLDKGVTAVKYDGRTLSPEAAKERLSRDAKLWAAREKELKSQEKLLQVQERKKLLAEEQLNALITQQKDLQVRVAEAEATLKEIRVEQTESRYQIDETRLSDIKSTLADIEHKVQVEREKMNLNNRHGVAGQPAPEAEVSLEDIRKTLGSDKADKVVLEPIK